MAIGANVPDENLVPGWNSQGNFTLASTVGTPGQGYATSGAVPASPNLSASSQASSGLPQPPGALNINAENSGSQTVPVLTNPGYADGTTLLNPSALPTTPVPTTTGVQNPYGMNATVTITNTTTATTAAVAPYAASAATAVFGSNQPVIVGVTSILVPPAGWVKVASATNITGVVWTPVN